MNIDFGKASADYARHRRGFPDSFHKILRGLEFATPNSRVLDVGSGTGALAVRFAADGARVTALDISAELLAEARGAAEAQGLSLETTCSTLEGNPLSSAAFDFISAGQCWHWFDPVLAVAELRRLLAPKGRVLLCSYDWVPQAGSVVAATEALILEHNPAWHLGGMDGRHPEWERDLKSGGFEIIEAVYNEEPASYSHVDWRGRIRASAGISASLSASQVERFDTEHAQLLSTSFPEDPLVTPHLYGYCLAQLSDR
ncbi:MAG: SAM-dependent methyltransferase [Planctomycetota bacterium]|jgi:SAM-dependent methyltransferase